MKVFGTKKDLAAAIRDFIAFRARALGIELDADAISVKQGRRFDLLKPDPEKHEKMVAQAARMREALARKMLEKIKEPKPGKSPRARKRANQP